MVNILYGDRTTIPNFWIGLVPYAATVNIGNTRSENLMEFVRLIEKAVGRKADLDMKEMQPGDVRETYADVGETTRITGFKPKTPIADGVPKFVAWYKDYYKVA